MAHSVEVTRRFLRKVYRHLTTKYEPPEWHVSQPAIDELILTVLSQNTNDRNSGEGFRRLKERFADWGEVEKAPARAVASAIKVSGLSRIKSKRIKAILRRIREERGSYSLDFLRNWTAERANDYLRAIPGVGPKTAACVLIFSFGKPVFPVDTHILRVSKRLGILDEKTNAEAAHELLQAAVPKELTYPLHLLMIRHGRDTCHALKPDCPKCILLRTCPFGKARTARKRLPLEQADGTAANTAE